MVAPGLFATGARHIKNFLSRCAIGLQPTFDNLDALQAVRFCITHGPDKKFRRAAAFERQITTH